jgi:hypothetical protein
VSGQHLQTVETKSLFLSHFLFPFFFLRARAAREGPPGHPSRANARTAAAAAARARFKVFIGKNLAKKSVHEEKKWREIHQLLAIWKKTHKHSHQ